MPSRIIRARLSSTTAALVLTAATAAVTFGPAASGAPSSGAAAVTAGQTRMGAWLGNPGSNPDQKFQSMTGRIPGLAVSYYGGRDVTEDYETARVRAGTVVIWDLDKKSWKGQISAVANRTDAGLDFIRKYLTAAARVDKAGAAAGKGGGVMISGWHEWAVKVNKGIYAGSDGQATTYARAMDVLIAERDKVAPGVQIGYVDGFHAGGDDHNRKALAAMTRKLDWVGIDRYVTNNGDYRSAATMWGEALQFVKAQSATRSIPVWAMETGVDVSKGENNLASWIRRMREDMASVGISGAIWFDSNSGPAGDYEILTVARYAKAAAAFKAEVAEVR